MNETVIWLVAGGGSGVIAFITFWMTQATKMAEVRALAEAADARAKSSEHMATVAIAKVEMTARDLSADKVDMTGKFAALDAITRATASSLAQSEMRLAKSIEDMGEKIDRLSDTLIKTLSEILAGRTGSFQRKDHST